MNSIKNVLRDLTVIPFYIFQMSKQSLLINHQNNLLLHLYINNSILGKKWNLTVIGWIIKQKIEISVELRWWCI